MSPGSTDTAQLDKRSLAASLAPLLLEANGDRLGDVVWFKADWQRGGTATGICSWRGDDGHDTPAVLKLPVGQRELMWMRRLQQPDDADPVVPRLFASGESIAGYDLAWIAIEKFEHGPLGAHWNDGHIPRIAEAIARFHAGAARYEVDQPPRFEPWDELIKESVQSVRTNEIPEQPRWTAALKALGKILDRVVTEWRARPVDQWLHGDAHLANAMSRHGLDEGSVSLIDLAEVHAGHWVEDAVFLERQFWARPERMQDARPVKAIADARRALGLPVTDDYPHVSMIRRTLLAATAPKFIKTEGHPKHLEACLKWLEVGLKELR